MSAVQAPVHEPHRFLGGAQTELGRRALRWLLWSLGLLAAAAFGGWLLATGAPISLLELVAFLLLVSWVVGIAAGVVAGLAIWRGERALIVYVAFLPIVTTLLAFVYPLFFLGGY